MTRRDIGGYFYGAAALVYWTFSGLATCGVYKQSSAEIKIGKVPPHPRIIQLGEARRKLRIAEDSLKYDDSSFLPFLQKIPSPGFARSYIADAAALVGNGDANRLLDVYNRLPDMDPNYFITSYRGKAVDNSTFAKERENIRAIDQDIWEKASSLKKTVHVPNELVAERERGENYLNLGLGGSIGGLLLLSIGTAGVDKYRNRRKKVRAEDVQDETPSLFS
jgi:hypothetical protein